jgi:hypothetical protein
LLSYRVGKIALLEAAAIDLIGSEFDLSLFFEGPAVPIPLLDLVGDDRVLFAVEEMICGGGCGSSLLLMCVLSTGKSSSVAIDLCMVLIGLLLRI